MKYSLSVGHHRCKSVVGEALPSFSSVETVAEKRVALHVHSGLQHLVRSVPCLGDSKQPFAPVLPYKNATGCIRVSKKTSSRKVGE
jgi:hypothetical protein